MSKNQCFRRRFLDWLAPLTVCSLLLTPAALPCQPIRVSGQSVYVPVYSHIYTGDRETPFLLAVTLSIRNSDPADSVTIEAVDYYDSNGGFIRKYLERPQRLEKLAAVRFVVKESDREGGSGACFIVRWRSLRPVSPPVIEAVMISTRSGQGISFASRGQVIPDPGE